MDLKEKKVLIFGSGKSGIGAARLLVVEGAFPVIYDQNEKLTVEEVLAKLTPETAEKTRVILGSMSEDQVKDYDLLVMSPGVPCDIPLVDSFKAAGIPVWGELELAWKAGKGKVLAVTGTNGKTTTTSLLGKLLEAAFPETYVVGNIGTPYTDVADRQTDAAMTAAEVSSFQLETIDTFHPVASVITNITPDHLNRHHTMEEYIRVKELITKNQTADDLCVLNYEDEILRPFGEQLDLPVMFFSSLRKLDKGIYLEDDVIRISDGKTVTDVVKTGDLQLLGLHNYENVMCAVAMAAHAGVPMDLIRKTICEFSGVEHRIEYVTEVDGVRYYNDSKGTNPDAAIKGIQAMNRPTLLIGGGYDKQSTYEEWIMQFDNKVKALVLIGQTREKIRDAALRCGYPEQQIHFCEDLKEAVSYCAAHAESGDAVLLSPACASWGQFKSYEQRGDLFKEYVRSL